MKNKESEKKLYKQKDKISSNFNACGFSVLSINPLKNEFVLTEMKI